MSLISLATNPFSSHHLMNSPTCRFSPEPWAKSPRKRYSNPFGPSLRTPNFPSAVATILYAVRWSDPATTTPQFWFHSRLVIPNSFAIDPHTIEIIDNPLLFSRIEASIISPQLDFRGSRSTLLP